MIRPDLHAKMCKLQQEDVRNSQGKERVFKGGDQVWVRDFSAGRKWIAGTVINVEGDRSCSVELVTGFVLKRHVDQMRVKAYGDLEIQRDTVLLQEGSRGVESGKVVPNIEVPKVTDIGIVECEEEAACTEVGSTEASKRVKIRTDSVGSSTPELRRSPRVRKRPEKYTDFVNEF